MRNLTLLTDLYELTMGQGYFRENRHEEIAVFDVFFRPNKLITYSVAAGMEQAAQYLENLHFAEDDIAYLRSLGIFTEDYLAYLGSLRFTGDVYAVREGEIVFPYEPILTVKAPMIQAQLVETALLTIINHQTLIASKASKICAAAQGDVVMEFGLRRAQGADAGVYGARAAVIGGCNSTSNVYAGKLFDIPVAGTMAHSWVMNFPSETEAFRAYARSFPDNCLLLVDTYDTLRSGVPHAIEVFRELRAAGHEPKGIRLDSGDLAYLSKEARKMLDDAGFEDTIICASGDLDEYSIRSLKEQGAKIDSWGVGTKLITSADMPALGGVYKLAAVYEDGVEIPKIKLSDTTEKITNPSFKEVYRIYDRATDKAIADYITRADEVVDESKPLLLFHPVDTWKRMTVTNFRARKLREPLVMGGKRTAPTLPLQKIAAYCAEEKGRFWEEYTRQDMPHIYKVDLSPALYTLKREMVEKLGKGE